MIFNSFSRASIVCDCSVITWFLAVSRSVLAVSRSVLAVSRSVLAVSRSVLSLFNFAIVFS
nr:hypothetical protein ['Parthenium sp.' phyllody phytoplasma]